MMTCNKIVWSLLLALSWVPYADAGPVTFTGVGAGDPFIVVDLIPDNPGPYFGGERVTVDVWLEGENLPGDILLGLVRFDFLFTDLALTLDPTFAFDFSSVPGDPAYIVVPQLPLPVILNDLFCCPGTFLRLSTDSPLRIGSVEALLPTDPGTFRIDALDRLIRDPAFGALVETASPPPGFPILEFNVFDRGIRGGRLDFVVVPEPTSFMLLLAGVLGLACRPGAEDPGALRL